MTLQKLIQQYENPNRFMSPDEVDKYIAAKQVLALEEIAFQLQCIQETIRDAQNSRCL